MLQSLGDLWQTLWRQPDFTIRIEAGGARLSQGQAPRGFVADCALLARERGLQQGRIYGLRRSRGLVLAFSRELPEGAQQALRNLWQIYA